MSDQQNAEGTDQVVEHIARVDITEGRAYPYRPACSCGWTDSTSSNRNVAQRIADLHATGQL